MFASPTVVLFLALFASQAGVLVMSPILARVAAEFDVSIAEAGQLRILAAPFAAGVALLTGRALARYSPRALIGAGSALLAVGSLASAAAPTFVLLALAQVPMWGGIAMLLAAGVAATGAWSTPEERTRLVSRALAGAPAAWIVGMPVIGLVSSIDWRLAFLVLPLPAAVLAGLAAVRRPADTPIAGSKTSLTALLRIPLARRWALGELAANSAWAGTLVYSGVLFTETYGTSSAATGVALAIVAAAYLAGNQWAGRTSPALARQWMLRGSLAASIAVALTWAYTRSFSVTLVLFALTAAVTAVRMVSGTVYGFAVAGRAPQCRRHRSRRHDPVRLPVRLARRGAGDRGRWHRSARCRLLDPLPRRDTAVRLPPRDLSLRLGDRRSLSLGSAMTLLRCDHGGMATIVIDTPHGPAHAHISEPTSRRGVLVLGHGAGGGIGAKDLVEAKDVALAAGLSCGPRRAAVPGRRPALTASRRPTSTWRGRPWSRPSAPTGSTSCRSSSVGGRRARGSPAAPPSDRCCRRPLPRIPAAAATGRATRAAAEPAGRARQRATPRCSSSRARTTASGCRPPAPRRTVCVVAGRPQPAPRPRDRSAGRRRMAAAGRCP